MVKTYSVGKVKQLIDLNEDSVNFDITFRVSSHNKEPFYLLVVDQTTLDSSPDLQYKHIQQGEISGSVLHDKNVYQNYFLILKADEPCECDVEITKKELPRTTLAPINNKKNDGFNWVKILIIVTGVVVAGLVLYWMFRKKENTVTYTPLASPKHSPNPSPNPILQKLKNLNLT
jgi:hypothetical protein